VRVVSGSAGGRRLVTPAGGDTRPTSDRVREATFNALGSLDALAGARVLDLFAGSGALGIEALSRGADHATFVDQDRAARAAVEANLAACGFADRARVVATTAERFLVGPGERWDLALLDPPYDYGAWPSLWAALPADLAVVETGREPPVPGGWEVLRSKRYGRTWVTILQAAAAAP
jgi:16S rRNA (guanine966-N2)-methyltransferase